MKNIRKIIIISVIALLVIFLCLFVYKNYFIVNNPIENNTIQDEKNEETDEEISYENALEMVIKAEKNLDNSSYNGAMKLVSKLKGNEQRELLARLEIVKKIINIVDLVENLESKVNKANSKSDIDAARKYRNNNNIISLVSDLTNEKVKVDLEKILSKLSLILDDTTDPIVNIKDGSILSSKTNIYVEDSNSFYINVENKTTGKKTNVSNGYLLDEGVYVLTITDVAYNKVVVNVNIDLTSPSVKSGNLFVGSYDDSKTKFYAKNNSVIYGLVIVSEKLLNTPSFSLVNNGNRYTINNSSVEFSKENNNYIYKFKYLVTKDDGMLDGSINLDISNIKDLAGNQADNIINSSKNEIILDKTIPSIKVISSSIGSDNVYSKLNLNLDDVNGIKRVVINDNKLFFTGRDINIIDGNNYTFENGNNTILVEDEAGNIIEKSFTIDTVGASISVLDSSVGNGTYYSKLDLNIKDASGINKVLINDKEFFVNGNDFNVIDGVDYNSISGTTKIEVVDKAGNVTTKSFSIDKTKPTLIVKTDSVGSDGYYSKLNLQAYDSNSISEVIINGRSYSYSGKRVDINDGYGYKFYDGELEVTAVDKAGNSVTEIYIIDKTAPVITELDSSFSNGDLYRNFDFNVTDNYSIDTLIINNKELTISDKNMDIIDGVNYSSINGSNNITVSDKAGNVTTKTIEIDKVKPTITVKTDSVGSDGYYSKLNLKIYDSVGISKVYINDSLINVTPGKYIDINDGSVVTFYNGKQVIRAVDKVGNEVSATFIVDKIAPKITILDSSIISSDDVYSKLDLNINETNKIKSIIINEEEFEFTGNNIDIIDGEDYNFKDGDNTIEVKDSAGNSVTKTFVLNNEKPTIMVLDSSVGSDGYYSKLDVRVKDTGGLSKILINGEEFVFDGNSVDIVDGENYVFESGDNTIRVEDNMGNYATLNFIKDVDTPVITIFDSSVGNGTYYSKLDLNIKDDSGISEILVNDKKIDIDGENINLEDGVNYNSTSGNTTIEIIDKAGNTISKTYLIDKTKPSIYAKSTSVGSDGVYSKLDVQIYDSIGVVSVTINGKIYNYSGRYIDFNDGFAYTFYQGKHTIVAIDKAGNESTKIITVDKTAPTIELVGDAVIDINNNDTYTELGAKVIDNVDEERIVTPSIINYYDTDDNLVSEVSEVDVSTPGRYEIVYSAIDKAGNSAISVTRTVNVINENQNITEGSSSSLYNGVKKLVPKVYNYVKKNIMVFLNYDFSTSMYNFYSSLIDN